MDIYIYISRCKEPVLDFEMYNLEYCKESYGVILHGRE